MTYFFDGVPAGSDTQIAHPIVTPWANELITLEADLSANARKLILNMAQQLAMRDISPD